MENQPPIADEEEDYLTWSTPEADCYQILPGSRDCFLCCCCIPQVHEFKMHSLVCEIISLVLAAHYAAGGDGIYSGNWVDYCHVFSPSP